MDLRIYNHTRSLTFLRLPTLGRSWACYPDFGGIAPKRLDAFGKQQTIGTSEIMAFLAASTRCKLDVLVTYWHMIGIRISQKSLKPWISTFFNLNHQRPVWSHLARSGRGGLIMQNSCSSQLKISRNTPVEKFHGWKPKIIQMERKILLSNLQWLWRNLPFSR